MINYLALGVALALSGVSGYYSIIGLTTIFASAFWPVVIMGSVLEVGKLVTASWLYRNWKQAPFLIKTYLSTAVFILMFITSMGIFGFLSKAHIDQTVNLNTGVADQIQILKSKISFEKQSIEDLDKQIQQIDSALNKMTDRGQAASALKAADQQRKTRESLVKRKDDHVKNISAYTEQRIRSESEIKKLEAEVGPLRYIAELIYEVQSVDNLERSVRMVILLLVFVFDPLAIVLLIAANIGIINQKRFTKEQNIGILEIDDKVLDK
jgi:hypothetical protein